MKKILLVEDQESIRELLKETLGGQAYQFFDADSAEQSVEIAKKQKPDLIIMDIMMPGNIDGLQATRMIKQNPETKDCLVILLTAKGQDKDRELGYEAGADEYFIKPFSPLELIKKVEELI